MNARPPPHDDDEDHDDDTKTRGELTHSLSGWERDGEYRELAILVARTMMMTMWMIVGSRLGGRGDVVDIR